jgi:hypothetical protein
MDGDDAAGHSPNAERYSDLPFAMKPAMSLRHCYGVRDMRLICVLTFVVAGVMLSVATGDTNIYRNKEFGIILPVPSEALLCPVPKGEHDHGPYMLLGSVDVKGCHDLEHSRSIDVFASYNVSDETKHLPEFLKTQCFDVAGGPCRPAPEGLRLTGLSSKAARVDRPDGWIDIIVVTQAGKPDPAFDPSVPSINYALFLRTKSNYLVDDIRVFRRVLQGIQLPAAP